MALAAALHHNAGPSKKKVVERRERHEEEVYETHVALQGPKTPSSGDAARSPGGARAAGSRRRLEPRWSMACRPLPCLNWRGRQPRKSTEGALSSLLQPQLAPRVEEEDEQQVDKHVPESVEWVQLLFPKGKRPTTGFTRVSRYDLPPLPPG